MIVNGKITSTFLGIEDHGIFTAFLYLDHEKGSQGYGGFAFDGPPPKGSNRRKAGAFGAECILHLLQVLAVQKWEALPGTVVRVDLGAGSWDSKIQRIGHFMEDRWFSFEALASGVESER